MVKMKKQTNKQTKKQNKNKNKTKTKQKKTLFRGDIILPNLTLISL